MLTGEIKEFSENGVTLKDGTYLQLDAVLYATGFRPNLSFLDEPSFSKIQNLKGFANKFAQIRHFCTESEEQELPLFLHLLPIQQQHATLFFIGYVRLFGPYILTLELQARYKKKI